MSYYYNYYLGYKYGGKMYVLGPFDNNGNLCSILVKSRSYASKLYEKFRKISDDEISDDIRKHFEYRDDYTGKNIVDLKVLEVDKLPSGEFVKRGYVLIDDVKAYENGDDDVFYNVLSPTVYAAKADNERMFGKNEERTDEYGGKYHEPNASEYMYYAWVDRNSVEYESFIIADYYNTLVGYSEDGIEYFVLLSEG